MNEIMRLIQKWVHNKSSGKITINFFKGGISSYKVEETFKPQESVRYIDNERVGECRN